MYRWLHKNAVTLQIKLLSKTQMILLPEDFKRYHEKEFSNYPLIRLTQKIILMLSNSGLFAVVNHRLGFWTNQNSGVLSNGIARFSLKLLYHLGRKISLVWGKVYIFEHTSIGPGLYISNKGGVIIGAKSIGNNCTIGSSVTIGLDVKNSNLSKIGNLVTICDNSLVYGGIIIGDGSMIREGSILSKSIPGNAVAQGNPARIIPNQPESTL